MSECHVWIMYGASIYSFLHGFKIERAAVGGNFFGLGVLWPLSPAIMTLKQRPDGKFETVEMQLGVRNRSSNQGSQSMVSFARDHSEGPGVESALLDNHRQGTERRNSSDSRGAKSGTDLDGNSMEEEPANEHEHETSSSDESPPDNSS